MNKFFTVAAFLLMALLLVLLATNNAGNPAVLSTVEYAVNTDAAIADRAAERAHNERMAEIGRDTTVARLDRVVLMVFGGLGIVSAAILGGAAVYGVASRPKVVVHRIEDRAGGVTVFEEERKKLGVR